MRQLIHRLRQWLFPLTKEQMLSQLSLDDMRDEITRRTVQSDVLTGLSPAVGGAHMAWSDQIGPHCWCQNCKEFGHVTAVCAEGRYDRAE